MRRATMLLMPIMLGAGGLLAAPGLADDGYDACMDRAGSNADFSVCGSAMLERREAELNRVWKAANAGLDAGVKKALLEEQRAWIAYKDKSCLAWTTGHFGREGQVVHFYVCRGDVIDARIAYLEDLGDPGEPEEAKKE